MPTGRQKNSQAKALPTFFIPHGGGPCFFMDWTMGPANTWHGMASWLEQLASTLTERPKSILIISAHWEEDDVTIIDTLKHSLLYDYSGFPEHTYQLKYDVPASPELARKVHNLLAEANIPSRFEQNRGLDHGVFIPLKLVYPEADIPLVQISLTKDLSADAHIALGQALAPLREEGVLIIGSGMSYHNLRHFDRTGAESSISFDNWLVNTVTSTDSFSRNQKLSHWENAPAARLAHPRAEHLIPLMVAAGAGGDDVGKQIYSERVNGLAISAFQFG